jgi:neuropeptide S receptor 1
MFNISTDVIMSYHQWSTDKIIRILILTSIMCVTLMGNVYIIFELFCRRHRHRTRLHLFILNLAIGDLAICFWTMTSELFLLIFDQKWILGNIACKLTLYIQVVTIASTTFINVAMTYDRYGHLIHYC